MKIGFVEWYPRYCGATDWAVHASRGAVDLGHDMRRVTFSKSGKRLAAWGMPGKEWEVHRVDNVVDVLRSFDLIILSDIVCRAPQMDKQALREGDQPYWVSALETAGTPWTTMIHDGCYPKLYDRAVDSLLNQKAFSNVLITTRVLEARRYIEDIGGSLFGPQVEWVVYPYLPYDPNRMDIDPRERSRGLINTSRITSNKGQDIMLDLFADLDCDMHLWGFCSHGVGTSNGWTLWELGLALGYDQSMFPKKRRDKETNTHPDVHKYYTGEFALGRDEWRYRYHGGFDHTKDVGWDQASWSISLTNDSLTGTIEYQTLDAIHAGTPAIVPNHAVSAARYEHLVRVPYERHSLVAEDPPSTGIRYGPNRWDREATIEIINACLDTPNHEVEELAWLQRREVLDLHAPQEVVSRLLGALT